MIRYCLLLLPVLLTACGSHSSSTSVATSDSIAANNALPMGNFYKRFSGTIAGKPVVVQLHRWGTAVQGSYQYTSVGQVIGLRNRTDTVTDDEFFLSETLPGVQADGATWSVTIHGSTASGEWRSPDGAKRFPISLTENYPMGSTRLEAFYVADSAVLFPDKPSSPKAIATYSYLLPAGGAKGFLYDALRSQIAPNNRSDDEVDVAIKAENTAYFRDYRKENASIRQDDAGADMFIFNYTSNEGVSVLYNDNYWLVTDLFSASYTGGIHGNYGWSYANIDLQQQRVWNVTDIITDTAVLRPMLNDAAILYFGLKPGEGMEQRMLVDEVPPTNNVYLSATGLSFVYNPYEIASYADGQVLLFLPYKKLMPFLTPAFKARMNLAERAGVAMLSTHL
jgi:hypothetical protein